MLIVKFVFNFFFYFRVVLGGGRALCVAVFNCACAKRISIETVLNQHLWIPLRSFFA